MSASSRRARTGRRVAGGRLGGERGAFTLSELVVVTGLVGMLAAVTLVMTVTANEYSHDVSTKALAEGDIREALDGVFRRLRNAKAMGECVEPGPGVRFQDCVEVTEAPFSLDPATDHRQVCFYSHEDESVSLDDDVSAPPQRVCLLSERVDGRTQLSVAIYEPAAFATYTTPAWETDASTRTRIAEIDIEPGDAILRYYDEDNAAIDPAAEFPARLDDVVLVGFNARVTYEALRSEGTLSIELLAGLRGARFQREATWELQ